MSRSTVCVLAGTPVKEIARVLAGNHASAIPVVDTDRRVIGIISASDLLPLVMSRRWHHSTPHTPAADARTYMMVPVDVVAPDTSVAEAARLASRTGVHVLPVVDETGVLLGVASRTDLVSALLRADDDIRRDAEDEVERRSVGDVRVHVDRGVVTLTGSAPSSSDAARIGEAVSRMPGVIDLVNLVAETAAEPEIAAQA